MSNRELVETMQEEVIDVLDLWFNEVDNKEEIIKMLTEGGEAGFAGYQVFGTLKGEDGLKAGVSLGLYISKYFEERLLQYSDEVDVPDEEDV